MDQIQINQESDARTRDLMYAARALNTLSSYCHRTSVEAGWWAELDDIRDTLNYSPLADVVEQWCLGAKLALIHSEASEALEGLRKGQPDSHLPDRSAEEVELADLLIRVFDYAGKRDLDLSGALVDKMRYNRTRTDHQLEARQSEGGKKF